MVDSNKPPGTPSFISQNEKIHADMAGKKPSNLPLMLVGSLFLIALLIGGIVILYSINKAKEIDEQAKQTADRQRQEEFNNIPSTLKTNTTPTAQPTATPHAQQQISAPTNTTPGIQQTTQNTTNNTQNTTNNTQNTTTTQNTSKAIIHIVEVNMEKSPTGYSTEELTIKRGDTVRWIQTEMMAHTVTSDDNDDGMMGMGDGQLFSSGNLEMGEVYEFKFDNVGEFPYYCDYHLMPMNGMMPMKARVTVVDDESRECNDNRATCENICCATTQHCSDEDPQLSPPTSLWQQFVAWIDALAGEKPRLSPDDPICVDNIEETEEEEIPTTCSDADGEDLFTKGEAIVTGEATLTVRDTCLSEWETLAAEHEAYQNLLNMIIEEGVITQDQLGDGGIILEAYCPTEVEFTFDPIMYQKAHSCEGSCSEGACIEKEEDPEPQTHRLDIQGAHQDLAINVGDTVTWTNLDSAQHTVTSDPETPVSIGSASLNQDETFSFTFDTPGTYPYHCTIHPGMTGTITVQ